MQSTHGCLEKDIHDIAATDWIYVLRGVIKVSLAVKPSLFRRLRPEKLWVYACVRCDVMLECVGIET